MMRTLRYLAAALVAGVSTYAIGCNGPTPPAVKAVAPSKAVEAKPKGDEEHAHKPGAHGGILVAIGRDNYHAEAVFEKGGVLRLYTLDNDEAKLLEVEAQPLTGYVKVEGGAEATSFVLKAEPQQGDKAGQTSQFVGHLPREMWGQKLDVTIPSLTIRGERFRVGFKSVSDALHADEPMPGKVSNDEEKKLYLTSGGKYTLADIQANGNVVASVKFKGVQASHDLKPKPGDKICPITLTKANPKFSWVVGGKTYEFCCPPCVDEFVQLAKDKPEEIKEPEEYRKK
ncbi:MAG: hypothetical protein U0746_10340 [Gemmataceae bacterium]